MKSQEDLIVLRNKQALEDYASWTIGGGERFKIKVIADGLTRSATRRGQIGNIVTFELEDGRQFSLKIKDERFTDACFEYVPNSLVEIPVPTPAE